MYPLRNDPTDHMAERRNPLATSSATFPPDLNVLDGYLNLIGGQQSLLPVIRFEETVWDFQSVTGIPRTLTLCDVVINWHEFSFGSEMPTWTTVMKEMAAAMLCPQHPIVVGARLPSPWRVPIPIGSVRRKVLKWARWLRWLREQGITRLGQVTQDHCDAYIDHALTRAHPHHAMDVATAVRDVSDYSRVLSERYRERFRPWGERSIARVVGYKKSRQNKTPWIPEDVFDTLLVGALFMTEKPADDIIAARDELRLIGRAKDMTSSRPACDRELPALLDRYRSQGRPLPAACRYGGVPLADPEDSLRDINLYWLGRQAGLLLVHSALTPRHRVMLEAALAELGTESGGMATRVSEVTRLDGSERPWREPFSPRSLHMCLNRLADACFIVILALTGMRHSEVLALQRGCIAEEADEHGHVSYRIHGRVFKGQPHGGKPASWRVVAQVKRAVEVLEKLAAEGGDQLLFIGGRTSWPESNEQDIPKVNERLNAFLDWQNTHGQVAGLPEVPDVNGQPWRLYVSQFRRTLARELAFRPHGTIAAKVHLKHLRATVTEGYIGPPGEAAQELLREIEQEEAAVREEVMQNRFEEWSAGGPLTGGGVPDLIEDFVQIQKDLDSFKGTIDQRDKRLRELLRKRAGALHIGILNDCHFDYRHARCLRKAGIERADAPIMPACEPGRCGNAVIALEHVPRWQQPLIQLRGLRHDPKIPRHERERLGVEEQRIKQVIASLIDNQEDVRGTA